MSSILITGSNRGLGLEFCKHYLSDGHSVYACCRSPAFADNLNDLQKQYPTRLSIFSLDVESDTEIHKLHNHLKEQPIDILINNAGIFCDKDDVYSTELWQKFFQINIIAPYLIIQTLIENIKAGKDKKIINITSEMGSSSSMYLGGYLPYRASKAALNNMTTNLATALKVDDIILAAIHPGWVRTDMGGPNGQLSPQESVAYIKLLISKLSFEDSGKFYSYEGKELPW